MLLSLSAIASCCALDMRHFVLSDSVRPRGIESSTPAGTGRHYYQLTDGGRRIVRRSYTDTRKLRVLLDSTHTAKAAVERWNGFGMSANEKRILLYTRKEPIYRHSFSADYYVWDVDSKQLTPLTKQGGEQIATFSPDGTMAAFVRNNNIYITHLDGSGALEQVTTDGVPTKVINGVPDWVYQEEFGILSSLAWSPDSRRLAFLKWDESEVPMCSMQIYEGACKPKKANSVHPGSYDYKYPCAGETNSTVTAHVYNLDTKTTTDLEVPSGYYIPHITFFGSGSGRLALTTLNRAQNHFTIYLPEESKTLYDETSDIWIDNSTVTGVKYFEDFLLVRSNRSGRTQLYRVDYTSGEPQQLTTGDEDLTAFYGLDAKRKAVYYQSTAGPLNRVVKSVPLDGNGTPKVLSPGTGTNSATFSADFSCFILRHNDSNTPDQYTLYDTESLKPLRVLQDNAAYAKRYCDASIPKREFTTFDNGCGYTLNGYIIKPADFDPAKKYPCIMAQYGGPGSQEVQNDWKMGWEQYFAMQGYVVACFDGRGTGARGKDFLKTVYLNLGKCETDDQIAAANFMMSQPYVDSTRVAVYGWSYGGFEALLCLSHDKARYAAGVAIAPVTTWKFYDTVYTERYMLTPQENPDGYKYSPMERTANLKGYLLLIFGSADDNVRITNSMEYVAKLNSENRLIDMMVYPNMNHSINGCDVRLPLYRKLLEFFDAKLKK